MESFSGRADLTDPEWSRAPDLAIGPSSVTLDGMHYRIHIDLEDGRGRKALGDMSLEATAGRLVPPIEITGAQGWRTGYVVPVMSGRMEGAIEIDGVRVSLDGRGYHDHNWGFWKDVSWQWGQVQGAGLSFVYGRIRPPADAADESRIPAFLVALGPDGPVAYATDVSIEETNEAGRDRPQRVTVEARSDSVELTLNLDVVQTEVTPGLPGPFGGSLDFLQLRARYRVAGRIGDTSVDFAAPGSAETFRGR
jgi:hypothetical protein